MARLRGTSIHFGLCSPLWGTHVAATQSSWPWQNHAIQLGEPDRENCTGRASQASQLSAASRLRPSVVMGGTFST
eukprot:365500-Chlamydomonas_euryale.AAC.2